MRRTAIPQLKSILNTSKLKIEMQIEMKWYIFSKCSTVAAFCNTGTQIEMRDGTVEHLPVVAHVDIVEGGVEGGHAEVGERHVGDERVRDGPHVAVGCQCQARGHY